MRSSPPEVRGAIECGETVNHEENDLALIGMTAVGVGLAACGGSDDTTPAEDAGADTGVVDSGAKDAAVTDSSVDAATDAKADSGPVDSGATDAGSDAKADTGIDASPAATCSDAIKNGGEADVDCGGACAAKCADGKACVVTADCTSGVCTANVCAAPTWGDTGKNGGEADVDCGGACAAKCGDGKACAANADCSSGVCGANNTCSAPTCADNIKNGAETDVDCGGAACGSCAIGKACGAGSDCTGGVCTGNVCALATSCKTLLAGHPGLASGVYTLDPDGAGAKPSFQAYCDMVSDGGGWTLALKADGTKQTFTYAAALWTNTTLLATDKPDLDLNEAKLASWNETAFTDVRLALVDGGVTRAVKIPKVATSLNAVYAAGAFSATNLGRASWKGILAAPSLQTNCNREGFSNSVANYANIRLGILGNNEGDCNSPDSWIGLGGSATACSAAITATVGNGAICGASGDLGDKEVKAFGYVFVR